jgi:general secretion pathway protein F
MRGFDPHQPRATFELVVRTAQGLVQTLEMSALDAVDARARAAGDGFQVLGCVPRNRPTAALAQAPTAARLGIEVADFAFDLSSLMAAGLSVVESLRTLASNEATSNKREAILDIVEGIHEGLPLSAALQRQPGRFPALLVATVSASEQTGDLSVALRRYAEHRLTIRALKEKVVGAAVYPALLLAVGLVVVMFLLTVVVPKFAVLLEGTRQELPWTSQLLMSWGRFAASHAWPISMAGLAVLVVLVAGARQVMRSEAKATWVDAVPLVGATIRQFRHAQLYRTTGMLVRGGVAAPRALQLGATLLGDADRKRLDQAIRSVHEGRSLSHALEEAKLADPVATSMLAVAERTGALADILERIAQFHESRLQRSVEMTSRLFEPLLMIVIGLVVGAIVVLMYLPIFDLASSLQ